MSNPQLGDGQTLGGSSLLVHYVNFVKLPHTVFALPFALVGVVYATFEAPLSWRILALVVVAFTTARFAAMGFNRIVDREMDALNPRTAGRELPTGRLSVVAAAAAVTIASAVFVLSAYLLNPLCLALSPVALLWILAYSYTKRFTAWSHLWLGLGDAIAGPAGYLAVTGSWSEPWWTLPALALAITCWIGGFDIFYGLQDESFDRQQGLASAVVRLGRPRAILAAKLLHAVTIASLVAFGVGAGFGTVYFVGIAAAAAILAYEHQLVKPNDLSRVNAAFFNMNGIMSVVVCVFAVGDRLL